MLISSSCFEGDIRATLKLIYPSTNYEKLNHLKPLGLLLKALKPIYCEVQRLPKGQVRHGQLQ
jgi:hypothetical protein